MINDNIDPIMRLNPQKIQKYLKKHHWKCVWQYPDKQSTAWEKKGKIVRLIPDKSLYSDYRRITYCLVRTVAEIEQLEDIGLYGVMPTIEDINRV